MSSENVSIRLFSNRKGSYKTIVLSLIQNQYGCVLSASSSLSANPWRRRLPVDVIFWWHDWLCTLCRWWTSPFGLLRHSIMFSDTQRWSFLVTEMAVCASRQRSHHVREQSVAFNYSSIDDEDSSMEMWHPRLPHLVDFSWIRTQRGLKYRVLMQASFSWFLSSTGFILFYSLGF